MNQDFKPMDPGQLRIGNFVYADGTVAEVVAIDSREDNDIEVKVAELKRVKVKTDKVQLAPIPLNKDTLQLCCNFNKNGVLPLELHPYLYALKIIDNHIVVINDKGVPTMHFWDVNTLHKLQNLYYALKETELQVNLLLQ